VDVTPVGIGREPVRLRRVAERTGLQIVMGTSFYRWPYRSEAVRALSAEAMADRMVEAITTGIDGTGIRSRHPNGDGRQSEAAPDSGRAPAVKRPLDT
jgi:phosphotriesterase-related protein